MRVLTETPFTLAPVPGRIGFPGHSLTLVVKGTFDLRPDAPATPAAEPLYPTSDEHAPDDDERTGPIRYASDFAPLKPATDLLLAGTCRAPGGKPVAACEVAFQVGEHRGVIRVSGERYWETRDGRWAPTEPEPFTAMPLAWDRAFGGEGYGPNPVGKGLDEVVGADGVPRRLLPNIEDPLAPVTSPDERPEPTGFGPLSSLWTQRQSKFGTYGEDYVERRWPWLAEDLDWACFNAAPRALQRQGYLRGDEPLVLENLHRDHPRYVSSLPGLRVRCFVTRPGEGAEERFDEVAMRLDTLWVDADLERLVLLWRGWTPVADEDFEEVQCIYVAAEPVADEPRPLKHYRARLAERIAAAKAGPSPGQRPEFAAPQSHPRPHEVEGAGLGGPEGEPHREPSGEWPPEPDARDTELDALLDGAMARVEAVMGLERSTLDLTDPEAARVKVKDYLRSRGVDPDHPREPTPEQRQAQARLFEGIGIPWDPVAGQPDLDRLQDVDIEALLGRTLEKLDADLAARGLGSREPPPLKQEEIERLRAIGIDAAALLDYLRSQEPAAEAEARDKRLDRDTVQARAAAGQSLAGADLSGLDLSGLDLMGADLAGAILNGARLAGAILADADLSGASLAAADLSGAQLPGIRLSGADLTGADLSGVDATGSDLTGIFAEGCLLRESRLYRATATGAYLAQADLTDVRARGLRLDGANLRGARLDGADLRRASLREARLHGASAVGILLDYADLTGLRASDGARLVDASLREASGPDSFWMGADLTGADLSYARLWGSDFSGAVLTGAQLHASDLRQARLRKTLLQGAGMTAMNLFHATLERADLSRADLRGSNLFGAELLGARLDQTKTEGANLRRTKLEGRRA